MPGQPSKDPNAKPASASAWIALCLAAILGGCSVGFDVPLSSSGDAAWTEKLLGYWKVEREGEEGAGVALLHQDEDGTLRLDALGPDGGLFATQLHFARHDGRDYAVLDLASFRTLDPGDPTVGRVGEQTVFGVPLLPAGEKSYGIALIRRDADRLTVYELDAKAVKSDLASRQLDVMEAEGCDSDLPDLQLDQPDARKPEVEGRPHWACILRIGGEAALRGYLEQRGDAIFDLDKPIRLTRLF